MASFPSLSSGAVTQYPTTLTNSQGVQVIRFLDASDQRFLTQGRIFRQWEIRLDLLNDTETAQLENFFLSQQGDYGPFPFPDPISGNDIPNCRIAAPALLSEYSATDIGATSLWVIETNG